MPVMVWLHSYAFKAGTGTISIVSSYAASAILKLLDTVDRD